MVHFQYQGAYFMFFGKTRVVAKLEECSGVVTEECPLRETLCAFGPIRRYNPHVRYSWNLSN